MAKTTPAPAKKTAAKKATRTPAKRAPAKTAAAPAGWRPPQRFDDTYRLVFNDPEYRGLEVHMRRMSFGAMRATASLTTLDRQRLAQGKLDQVDIDKLNAVLGELGEALVDWNLLDRGGNPVPCTVEALDRQDLVFGFTVLDAWMSGVQQHQMPTPLAEPAEPVDESILPMDVT